MKRILIAEDDRVSAMILEELLQPYGECQLAATGTEAVHAFRQSAESEQYFDLICMDIMMPDITGHQALKKIRAIEDEKGFDSSRKCKVIMVTALEDQKNVTQSFLYGGATAYVVKPVDKNKLLEVLKKTGIS